MLSKWAVDFNQQKATIWDENFDIVYRFDVLKADKDIYI